MKSWLSRFWKIALSLCVIFASGSGVGYLYAQRKTPVANAQPEGLTTVENWKVNALAKLKAELKLSPEQSESVSDVLVSTEKSVGLTRERALLQMHLQVLKAHDGFAPHLRPDQLAKLQQMREELKKRILDRFFTLLTEPEMTSLLTQNSDL